MRTKNKTQKKIRVEQLKVKVRVYSLITQAVESGVALGYSRAHKHTDTPSEDIFKQQIENAIMDNLCEIFDF